MCGIGGFIAPGAKSEWKRTLITNLLRQASSRGRSATGLAYVQDGKMCFLKAGEPADKFVDSKEFKEFTEKLPPIVMGHARAATGGGEAGPEDNLNNHPFVGEKSGIAVVHNGMIDHSRWRKTVGKDKGLSGKYPFTGHTDSELFLRFVENNMDDGSTTMIDAISDACWNITGSYALGWLKADEPNKIWFVRHNNPMVIGYSPKHKFMVFGSTKAIIEDSLTEYVFFLDWFSEARLPHMIYEEVVEDSILEVELFDKPDANGDLYNVTQESFIPAEKKHLHSHVRA